jgi:XTP/dITP diphosphohydrolase
MEIVIASNNLHKVREFREMLKPLKNLDVLSLVDFPEYQLPEETGKSFEENAIIKAAHAASTLNKWVLADDSGLVVPSLGGKPGVFSQRYAGEDATDAENRQKLLKEMSHLEEENRQAYFECCLVLANPQGVVKKTTGTVEGRIGVKEAGRNGFGYDPIFIKNDYTKTFAQLDEATKNKISHRRKAFEKMVAKLESLDALLH